MRRITFISIAITFFTFVLEINFHPQTLLHLLTDITFIILLWYLTSVLQFAGEDTSIQTPFSTLLGIGIVSIASYIFPISGQFSVLVVMNVVISFYVFIATYKVKNPRFSGPFKYFGITLIIVIIFKILTILIMRNTNEFNDLKYSTLIGVIPFLAVLNIVKRTGSVLIQETKPS